MRPLRLILIFCHSCWFFVTRNCQISTATFWRCSPRRRRQHQCHQKSENSAIIPQHSFSYGFGILVIWDLEIWGSNIERKKNCNRYLDLKPAIWKLGFFRVQPGPNPKLKYSGYIQVRYSKIVIRVWNRKDWIRTRTQILPSLDKFTLIWKCINNEGAQSFNHEA